MIKRLPLRIAVLVVILGLVVLDLLYNINGSGFRGKTLWDWLDLLIVPLVLAGGGIAINFVIQRREEQQRQEREQREGKESEERAERERKAADDQLQEQVLQAYLDRMSELLLAVRFDNPDVGDAVKTVARARTLTALRRLDSKRKAALLQFLYESGLIQGDTPKVNLSYANFSEVNFAGANLAEVNLKWAILVGAHFEGATLTQARLERAHLERAHFEGAHLTQVILTGAILTDAHLNGSILIATNLNGAILAGAHLEGANLAQATVTQEQLYSAILDENTTLPDGSHYKPPSENTDTQKKSS